MTYCHCETRRETKHRSLALLHTFLFLRLTSHLGPRHRALINTGDDDVIANLVTRAMEFLFFSLSQERVVTKSRYYERRGKHGDNGERESHSRQQQHSR